MDEYMNDIKEKHPAHRERFSNQAWLLQGKTADQVLKRLRKRWALAVDIFIYRKNKWF